MSRLDLALAIGTLTGTATSGEFHWVVTDAQPVLPPGMQVSGCKIVQATLIRKADPVTVSLRFEPTSKLVQFVLSHGEQLAAIEGRCGTGTVCLGMPDQSVLPSGAILGHTIADDAQAASFSVTVPALAVGQALALTFAFAWIDDWAGNADLEIAPWIAVDRALGLSDSPDPTAAKPSSG